MTGSFARVISNPGSLREVDMALLGAKEKEAAGRTLEKLLAPVRLVVFITGAGCQYCKLVVELAGDLASVCKQIVPEIHDTEKEPELAGQFGVTLVPAIAVVGEKDHGIRFTGVPAGHELGTFIETILMVGSGDHGLSQAVVEGLQKIDGPVALEVLISPTCPLCPPVVLSAHRFAMASPHVSSSMVEITEFPELAKKYEVKGVPFTVVNGTHAVTGVVTAPELLKVVLKALGRS